MRNPSIITSTKSFGLTLMAFLIVAFPADIASVLQTPTLSISLTDEVHARPAMVEFFFTGSATTEILVSQFLAGHSDRRGDCKPLIVFCRLLDVLACTLLARNRNYFVLLFVGVSPSSFGSTVNSQMFALACEHADKIGREAVMLDSFLRAQVPLAWVIGPPLAYALTMGFSFTVIYLSTVVMLIVCGVMVWLSLLSIQKELPLATGTIEAPRRSRRNTPLLFVTYTLMWGSNSLYIINASLSITNELHLPGKLTGVMMGTAAGLGVSTMLIAGYFVKRLGRRFSMRAAAMSDVRFYTGTLMVHLPAILLGSQLLNAISIGTLGSTGMLYFQDLMSGQAGSATTLYTNTSCVGWVIAGSVAGIVAEIWSYHAVFWFMMVMIIATLFRLLRIKDA